MRAFDFNLVQRDQASFATRALTCVALLVRIKIVSCVIVFLDLCVFSSCCSNLGENICIMRKNKQTNLNIKLSFIMACYVRS